MNAISIRDHWRADFAPRDRRPIYEWARDHVSLRGSMFIPNGPFEVAHSRRFIPIFNALLDPYVREVNLLAGVQDGKTIIADIWLPWIIANDPGPFLGVFQKDDIATDHCKLRTWPILQSVPTIRTALAALEKTESCTQEILLPAMPIFINGPVLTNLQSKPFRYLWCDESWMYRKGVILQAKGRLTQFVRHGLDKAFFTSQGGFVQDRAELETREWFEQFTGGELNELFVRCRACREFHLPVWTSLADKTGFQWDDHRDERGLWNIERCRPSLRYVCPLCRHAEPIEQGRMVQNFWNEPENFRYDVVGEPNPAKKSFHYPAIVSFPWGNLLEEYLAALNASLAGDRSKIIIFNQKRLAKFHDDTEEDETEPLPTIELLSAADAAPSTSPTTPPPPLHWRDELTGEEITFTHRDLMVDVSLRRLWCVASAWSDQGDDLTLEAREIPAEANGAFRYDLVVEMQKQWHILDQDVGWDVNYEERAQEVLEELCKHGHFETEDGETFWRQWIGYRGDRRPSFKFIQGKTMRLTPVVMVQSKKCCPDIEIIDPAPGIRAQADAPEFFIPLGEGHYRKKEAIVFRWSKPTITAILEARRDGIARGVRSVTLKGEWNHLFFKHMRGERFREHINRRHYKVMERYAAGRHDFADGKKMSIAHAIRRGYLIPGAETSDAPPPPQPA